MGGDCHIYLNHIEAVTKYLNYPIRGFRPTLEITRPHETLEDFNMSSFKIQNYFPGPVITAPMAV
jgi:thymidylate synthase